MKLWYPLLFALATPALSGCDGKDGETLPQPVTLTARADDQLSQAEQAAAVRRQVVRWLDCEECVDGELKNLQTLGQRAVPSLASTLREGPSPATREKLRLHLVETYGRLREYAATHPGAKLSSTETEFVERYLQNQDARYRARAAQALAAIGGVEARTALREFVAQQAATGIHVRRDVQVIIDQALKELEEATPTVP